MSRVSAPAAPGQRRRRGKGRINLAGLVTFEARSGAARALLADKRALLAELGPAHAGGYRVRLLVDGIVRLGFYLDHVDGVLLGYRTLLDRRHQLKALVDARDRLQGRLMGLLEALERLTTAKSAPDDAAAGVSRVLAKYPKPEESRP